MYNDIVQQNAELLNTELATVSSVHKVLSNRKPNSITSLNLSFSRPSTADGSFKVEAKQFLSEFTQFSFITQILLVDLELFEESSLDPLHHFACLELLDVSFNHFRELPNVTKKCVKLKTLRICANIIDSLEKFDSMSSVIELDVRLNPLCKIRYYREWLGQKCPSLRILNGAEVVVRAFLIQTRESFTQDSMIKKASCQEYIFRPLSVRTHRGLGSTTTFQEYHAAQSMLSDGVDLAYIPSSFNLLAITTLELDSCGLLSLDFMPERMQALKWVSFRDNCLRSVEKLEKYKNLEEICLEGNQIENIDSLSRLPNLTRLDVSNNVISNVSNAASFKALAYLSLEGNKITNLKCFVNNQTLMELYIGNNCVIDLQSVFPLKEVHRLIILDLAGNSIFRIKDYRAFAIFHLPRLKILDGASISSKEVNTAKELFSGKLTVELLGEKIGHFMFRNIVEIGMR